MEEGGTGGEDEWRKVEREGDMSEGGGETWNRWAIGREERGEMSPTSNDYLLC